jgi:predicted nucleic acid-binding Zn ribbon protein
MDSSVAYWKAAKGFSYKGDHLMTAIDEKFGSKIVCEKNDGRTLHFYYQNHSHISSNVGSTEVLINYDVRPNITGYKFADGRYVPHPRGDVKIEGYYPNYRVAGLYIPVYLGPHLYFYPEPQEDIIDLAMQGKLRAPNIHVRRQCLTCDRDIPMHNGPRAKYCSVECGLVTRDMLRRQKAANIEAKRFRLPEIKTPRKCKKCGGAIPDGVHGRAIYCSVECGLMTRDMQNEKRKYPCDYCGTLFSRFGRQRFCSEPCKLKDKLQCLKS